MSLSRRDKTKKDVMDDARNSLSAKRPETTTDGSQPKPDSAPESWLGTLINHVLTPGSASSRTSSMFKIINILTVLVFGFWLVGILATWDSYQDMRVHLMVFGFLLAGFTLSCNYVFKELMADDALSVEPSKQD